jgi:hypothetical protein
VFSFVFPTNLVLNLPPPSSLARAEESNFLSNSKKETNGYFHQVTTKYINGLIELIHSNLATSQDSASASLENPRRHFERTLEYIASREYEGVVIKPKT